MGVTAMGRLEKVQRRLTRIAVRRLLGYASAATPPYPIRCRMLRLPSIASRHSLAQSLFISNLLLHNLDAPILLSSLPFYAPARRLRERPPFLIPPRRTRFGQSDPLLRALSAFNEVSTLFNLHLPISTYS